MYQGYLPTDNNRDALIKAMVYIMNSINTIGLILSKYEPKLSASTSKTNVYVEQLRNALNTVGTVKTLKTSLTNKDLCNLTDPNDINNYINKIVGDYEVIDNRMIELNEKIQDATTTDKNKKTQLDQLKTKVTNIYNEVTQIGKLFETATDNIRNNNYKVDIFKKHCNNIQDYVIELNTYLAHMESYSNQVDSLNPKQQDDDEQQQEELQKETLKKQQEEELQKQLEKDIEELINKQVDNLTSHEIKNYVNDIIQMTESIVQKYENSINNIKTNHPNKNDIDKEKKIYETSLDIIQAFIEVFNEDNQEFVTDFDTYKVDLKENFEKLIKAYNRIVELVGQSGGRPPLTRVQMNIAKGTQSKIIESLFNSIVGKLEKNGKYISASDESRFRVLLTDMNILEENLLKALELLDKYNSMLTSGVQDNDDGPVFIENLSDFIEENSKIVGKLVRRNIAAFTYITSLNNMVPTLFVTRQ
jgi:chromosome segregation ATPase